MSEHPPTDLVYEGQLEAQLLHVLKTGPTNFRLVVAQAEGAYPTDVLAVLRKLEAAGAVAEGQNQLWMRTDSTSGPSVKKQPQMNHLCVGMIQIFPSPIHWILIGDLAGGRWSCWTKE